MSRYRNHGGHAARTSLLVQVTPRFVCRLMAPLLRARLLPMY